MLSHWTRLGQCRALSPHDRMSARLVLASTSQYRRELLQRLGIPFSVDAPDVNETALAHETPRDTAQRLALAKAEAVAARHPGHIVIGSDQVAASGGLRLGKPGTVERGVEQLMAVRGQSVHFFTAVCVIEAGRGQRGQHCDETRVLMRADLDEATIRRYLELDSPLDCAGSAKIESLGIALTERCDSSDPTALIGLPLIALSRILRECGLDPLARPD